MELLTNEKLRIKLSSKARPHAEEYYTLESCVKELIVIYRRVLGGKEQKSLPDSRLPYGMSLLGFCIRVT